MCWYLLFLFFLVRSSNAFPCNSGNDQVFEQASYKVQTGDYCVFPISNPQTITFKSFNLEGTDTFTIPDGTTINVVTTFTVGASATLTIEGKVVIVANIFNIAGLISGDGKGSKVGAEGLGYYNAVQWSPGGSYGGRGGKKADLKVGEQGDVYGSYKSPTSTGSSGSYIHKTQNTKHPMFQSTHRTHFV